MGASGGVEGGWRPHPRSAEWGHATAAAWGLLWLGAAVWGRRDPWALVVGVIGLVVAALVAFANRRSARAWLLLQLFTAIVLVCGVVSLMADGAGTRARAFIAVTALLQGASLVALNQRASRVWHGVDPEGWRTTL